MTTDTAARNYGSFRDSLRAPIHRWFTYPAGYSHELVSEKISQNKLAPASLMADPFLGTGTTSIVAKMYGMNSLGIEAHPFVHWVAATKMEFDYDLDALALDTRHVLDAGRTAVALPSQDSWPALIYKCFDEDNLRRLYSLKEAVIGCELSASHRDFLKLALTATLRIVTTAGAGWPYIAPSKYARRTVTRDAFVEFERRCMLMLGDLRYVQSLRLPLSSHRIASGDARALSTYTEPESIDLIVTSPPYLNNYDYADRTRLETYFWGIYRGWGEITANVRDKLIMAATTQVRISSMDGIRLCPSISNVSPDVHRLLVDIIDRLESKRHVKAGKKTYDYMVAGYFEDMLKVIQEAYRALKPHSQFILVLGDSAPYGVHIPTEEMIGRLALAVGFSSYRLELLRRRGDKWAHNPQRHKLPLRESILTVCR